MSDDLHPALTERLDEFVLYLDEDARRDGPVFILLDGTVRVFWEEEGGKPRGTVLINGEAKNLVELATLAMGYDDLETAAKWCRWWLVKPVPAPTMPTEEQPGPSSDGLPREPAEPTTVGAPDLPPDEIAPDAEPIHPNSVTSESLAGTGAFLAVPDESLASGSAEECAHHDFPSDTESSPAPPVSPERGRVQRVTVQKAAGAVIPDIHRLLPQSSDAEMGVLASILLAPHEVLAKCAAIGLGERHFHDPAHAITYEMLTWMHGERMEIDIITLTQQLRDQKKLDLVGGPAFVTDIYTGSGGTAANVAFYIEILEEKYTLREIIRVCTEYAARSYDEQDQVTTLLEEVEKKIGVIAKQRYQQAFDAMLGERAFNVALPPPEPPPVFMLGGAVIATPENFVMVQAKVKAGKTALLGGMLASTMEPTGDCLGISSSNPHGHAVIHFDTEQSKYHHDTVVRRVLRRAGRTVPPDWFFSYYMKGLTVEQLMTALRTEMKRRALQCGGIHSVTLDGIGDYCLDVNDPAISFALVAEIERLAVEYQTTFVLVLHENPGSDTGKTRGHLGSHLERKAETNLRMEKDADGVTVVYSDRARTAHIPKERGSKFAWNDEAMMQMSTNVEFKSAARAGQRAPATVRKNDQSATAKQTLAMHFTNGRAHRYGNLLASSKTKAASFSRYWNVLKSQGLIAEEKSVPGLWSASPAWSAEIALDFGDDDEATE